MFLRKLLTLTALVLVVLSSKAQDGIPTIKHYGLNVTIDYDTKKIYGNCELAVVNNTQKDIDTLTILLYRLLSVGEVTVDGIKTPYKQEIKSFTDYALIQANSIDIYLPKSIKSGDSLFLKITYSGYIKGYSETGITYLKDNIDREFTILRPECLVYPVLGKPELTSLKTLINQNFNYNLSVDVPNSMVVVNGGRFSNIIEKDGRTTYRYASIKPTYQIVTTIANYKQLQTGNIATYFFDKDSLVAKNVHHKMLKAFNLYSRWWGQLNQNEKFTLIEIPEGYGSQATENYIIQTASAFNKPEQIYEVYHEISHLWNVKPNDKYPPRWNEGLAMFIQYLTLEKFENSEIIDEKAREYLDHIKSDKIYGEISMVNFGKLNVTDRSYRVGYLFFYILYKTVGENRFHSMIRLFYEQYYYSGAPTDEFVKFIGGLSKKKALKCSAMIGYIRQTSITILSKILPYKISLSFIK